MTKTAEILEIPSQELIESAIKLFEFYSTHSELKTHARSNDRLAHLFSLAKIVVIPPSAEDSRKASKQRKKERKQQDNQILAVTGMRKKKTHEASILLGKPLVYGTMAALEQDYQETCEANSPSTEMQQAEPVDQPETATPELPGKFHYARACHTCGASFKQAHHFYDQLCPPCAEFNYAKRSFSVDMSGRVCLVTGARVKVRLLPIEKTILEYADTESQIYIVR